MPKRALICSWIYLPNYSGIPEAAHRTAVGLKQIGYQVDLVNYWAVPDGYQETDDFPVHRFPSYQQIQDLANAADIVIVEDDTLAMILPALSSQTPVVVVHQCAKSGCPSQTLYRAGKRCLPGNTLKCWTCAVGNPTWSQQFRRMMRYYIARYFLRHVDANVCLADYPRTIFRLPKSTVIPNPVDLSLFKPNGCTPSREFPRLAMAGRLSPEKGMEFGIQVLADLNDSQIHLDIHGDGPARTALEAEARRCGVSDRVLFHGWQRGEALADAYRRATLLLVPSNFEGETFCLVAAESLACRTPVVASDRGALPETVGAGGYALPLGDTRPWVSAVRSILDSPAHRESLAEAGFRHVCEKYSSRAVANAFDRLVADLQEGHARRSTLVRWQAMLASRLIDRIST